MRDDELKSISEPEVCPSDMELAAFLDGTLEPAKAEEVRRHVLDCPSCWEIYADAYQFEAAALPPVGPFPDQPDSETSKVLAFARPEPVSAPAPARRIEKEVRRSWKVGLSMAAGLVLAAISAFVLWPRLTAAPQWKEPFTPEEAAWTQERPQQVADQIGKGSVVVRETSKESAGKATANVRIGANCFDLEVAFLQRDRGAAIAAGNRLVAAGQSLFAIQDEIPKLGKVVQSLTEAQDPSAPLSPGEIESLRIAVDKLRPVGRDMIAMQQDLGFWAEGGWVATGTDSPSYFRNDKNLRFLAWLTKDQNQKKPWISLSLEGRQALADLAQAWPRDGAPAASAASLKSAFDQLRNGSTIAVDPGR